MVKQPVWEKENTKLKLAVLYLKIDIVSHSVNDKRVG